MATVREAVLDLFRTRGVSTVFGNPGSTELTLLKDFPTDLRYILGLHEAVVVGMADGHSLASGTTALVNVHTAPGLGNAMGALVNARANRTPMVVTAGQQVRAMMTIEALLTNPDPVTLPRPAVKWAFEPPRPEDVPAALARAFQIAETPPCGPVFVSVPMDDFDATLDEDAADAARATAMRQVTHAAAPPPDVIEDLARRIGDAARPALVIGGDVDAAGAWDEAVALAERAELAVWEAPCEGRVAFPHRHRCFRGQLKPAIGPLAGQLAGHDLVLVVGAPVFRYYPYVPGPWLPPGTELVLVTRDADEAARAPVGDALVADPKLTLRALAEAAGTSGSARGPLASRPLPADTGAGGAGPLAPAAALAALAKGAPQDTLWVNESPSSLPLFHDQIRVSRPGSFLFSAGGGLGFGLSAAVGAQLARPDRPVVAVVGDGSAQYAIQALWTAAAYHVPVTVVVLSNQRYAILEWFARLEHAEGAPGLEIPGIDITAVAAGFGVPAHRARTRDELTGLLQAATTARDGPVLIDVPVSVDPPTF